MSKTLCNFTLIKQKLVMARLDIERQHKIQPKRMKYCIDKITELGYSVNEVDDFSIQFFYKGGLVTMFPYSGWHTGKTIKDGRGIDLLLNQIKYV